MYECRRCRGKGIIEPMIGFKEVGGEEDNSAAFTVKHLKDGMESLKVEGAGYVPYISPEVVIKETERLLCEGGGELNYEDILEDDKALAFNLLYFVARRGLRSPIGTGTLYGVVAAWDAGVTLVGASSVVDTGELAGDGEIVGGDWEDAFISSVLVALVGGCESQDVKPAIEAIIARDRKENGGEDVDVYKTLLILLRTQSPQLFPR